MARRRGLGRVLVAVNPAARDLGALELAAELASRTQAHLLALFVEDENLFKLAELPFARELDRASGYLRPLESGAVARAMQADAERVREVLVSTSRSRRISWELKVVRGHYVACAIHEAGQHDPVFLSDAGLVVVDGRRRPSAGHAGARPVWVLFDGSPAAGRAVDMACEVCRERQLRLIAVLPEGSADTLRRQVADRVGTGLDLEFRQLPGGDRPAVSMAAAREACGLLLVPRGADMASEQETERFLKGLRCPLVLVA